MNRFFLFSCSQTIMVPKTSVIGNNGSNNLYSSQVNEINLVLNI